MPRLLVKLNAAVNQFNQGTESHPGDVIGIDTTDPKTRKIGKDKKPILSFGDRLMMAKLEGTDTPAAEKLSPEEAIYKGPGANGAAVGYLTRSEMKRHGYTDAEVKAAFEALIGDQKKALEKLEAGEARRHKATQAALEKAEMESASSTTLLAEAAAR